MRHLEVLGSGVSPAGGRPRLPLRLMIVLQYLKHAFNESDEGVVERWLGRNAHLAITPWAEESGNQFEYIQPGKSQQNAYVERFNPTVRYG